MYLICNCVLNYYAYLSFIYNTNSSGYIFVKRPADTGGRFFSDFGQSWTHGRGFEKGRFSRTSLDPSYTVHVATHVATHVSEFVLTIRYL